MSQDKLHLARNLFFLNFGTHRTIFGGFRKVKIIPPNGGDLRTKIFFLSSLRIDFLGGVMGKWGKGGAEGPLLVLQYIGF